MELVVAQVQAILNLDGDKTMSIRPAGAMQITVDSGMAHDLSHRASNDAQRD